MEYIISKIKDYVILINPSISRNDFLDFIVREVVDRALTYMNRNQLVSAYEEATQEAGFDVNDYDEELRPLPMPLWRPLATSVIGVYKEIKNQMSTSASLTSTPAYAVSRVKDNGQEVQYETGKIQSYLSSASDSEILSGISVHLDRYLLGTVIQNDNTRIIYRGDFTDILR